MLMASSTPVQMRTGGGSRGSRWEPGFESEPGLRWVTHCPGPGFRRPDPARNPEPFRGVSLLTPGRQWAGPVPLNLFPLLSSGNSLNNLLNAYCVPGVVSGTGGTTGPCPPDAFSGQQECGVGGGGRVSSFPHHLHLKRGDSCGAPSGTSSRV